MLVGTFFLSLTTVAGVVSVLMYERRSNRRFVPRVRHVLDSVTAHIGRVLVHGWTRFLRYMEQHVLLKGLHVITYVALVFVRYVERKLVLVSQRIRTFHRDHDVLRRSTHKLAQWAGTHEMHDTSKDRS